MISIENDALKVAFPDIDESQSLHISFQRTLRIPNDGQIYPLPPGLGNFPLRHIEDVALGDLEHRKDRGGVIMPMFQTDALWLNFRYVHDYSVKARQRRNTGVGGFDVVTTGRPYRAYSEVDLPLAIKVGAGKINALTGQQWSPGLQSDPQNYLVTPDQPWLDGFNTGEDQIRQFIATPLGEGQSVEEQLDPTSDVGGLQLEIFPMRKAFFRRLRAQNATVEEPLMCFSMASVSASKEMSLGLGGAIHQEIYEDEYGPDVWDLERGQRCFIMIANAQQWMSLTGEAPPLPPLSVEDYKRAGLPWFDHYDGDRKAIEGSAILGALKPVEGV
jgi:hypothetical protein